MIHSEIAGGAIPTPEVARRASRLIASVEVATADAPASLDIVADGENFYEMRQRELVVFDEFYDRHEELFFPNGTMASLPELDIEQILRLTNELLKTLNSQNTSHRAAKLGYAVLQFAKAGSEIANDPTLLRARDQEFLEIEDIQHELGVLGIRVFEDHFSERTRGNSEISIGPRLSYLGYLVATHYGFWSSPHYLQSLDPAMRLKAHKIVPRFPIKFHKWDMHSLQGRPSREVSRLNFVRQIEEFNNSLQEPGKGHNTLSNVGDAMPWVREALAVATQKGCTPQESLRLVAEDCTIIAKLTERGEVIKHRGFVRLIDPHDKPHFEIDYSSFKGNDHLDASAKRALERRAQRGGICPARHNLPLLRDGETHQNIQALSEALGERVGADANILAHRGDAVYVDPAALVVGSIVLAIADNHSTEPFAPPLEMVVT